MTKAKYRARLPQQSGNMFLTDGGMETTLIYHDKIELPCFASFTLLKTERSSLASLAAEIL